MEIAFVDRLHTEAMSLAYAARDRASNAAIVRSVANDPLARLQVAAASLQLTALVADIVAWTLLQKAMAIGELGAAELAAEGWALIDLPLADFLVDPLPAELARLLEKAHRLHGRVRRLHRQHGGKTGDQ
jgi:hypothetical protein